MRPHFNGGWPECARGCCRARVLGARQSGRVDHDLRRNDCSAKPAGPATQTGSSWGTGAQAAASEGTPPARAGAPDTTPAAKQSADQDVAEFIQKMKQMTPRSAAGRGRLIFAMDATMSRQPTWDMALAMQADMFHAVKEVGGLDVQLVFFRGAGECRSSKWVSDPDDLSRLMTSVTCRGGYTQIRSVLAHARKEAEAGRVSAMVYVGDAMEEDIDDLCGRAGELALHGLPVFLFQEGADARAATAYREIARLTKGAYCSFDAGSAASCASCYRPSRSMQRAGGRRWSSLAIAARAMAPGCCWSRCARERPFACSISSWG